MHWSAPGHTYCSQCGLPTAACIGIYTDSSNTVDIFSLLKALPDYSCILQSTVNLSLCGNMHAQFKVEHVAGKENTITNALSHCHFDLVHRLIPVILIDFCQPPQSALGAGGKWSKNSHDLSTLWQALDIWAAHSQASYCPHECSHKSTDASYSSAINSYIQFCKMHNMLLNQLKTWQLLCHIHVQTHPTLFCWEVLVWHCNRT